MFLSNLITIASFMAAFQVIDGKLPVECSFSDGEPVCAFDGNKFKLFPNECFLKSHKENNKVWVPTLMSKCIPSHNPDLDNKSNDDKCKIPCPRILAAVCGFDGKHYQIFDNECLMKQKSCEGKNQKWTRTNMLPCLLRNNILKSEDSTEECPQICSLNYDPVCGYDGVNYKIFSNDCALTIENCNKNSKWIKLQRIQDCQLQDETQLKLQLIDDHLLQKHPAKYGSCIKPCTREFNPICGFEGIKFRIFNNDCMLQNQICIDGHNWKKTDFVQCATINEVN